MIPGYLQKVFELMFYSEKDLANLSRNGIERFKEKLKAKLIDIEENPHVYLEFNVDERSRIRQEVEIFSIHQTDQNLMDAIDVRIRQLRQAREQLALLKEIQRIVDKKIKFCGIKEVIMIKRQFIVERCFDGHHYVACPMPDCDKKVEVDNPHNLMEHVTSHFSEPSAAGTSKKAKGHKR